MTCCPYRVGNVWDSPESWRQVRGRRRVNFTSGKRELPEMPYMLHIGKAQVHITANAYSIIRDWPKESIDNSKASTRTRTRLGNIACKKNTDSKGDGP